VARAEDVGWGWGVVCCGSCKGKVLYSKVIGTARSGILRSRVGTRQKKKNNNLTKNLSVLPWKECTVFGGN